MGFLNSQRVKRPLSPHMTIYQPQVGLVSFGVVVGGERHLGCTAWELGGWRGQVEGEGGR